MNFERLFSPDPGRILVWDCKWGRAAYFARNPNQAKRAYLKFFAKFDALKLYSDVENDEEIWYKQAKKGDWEAAYQLLSYRSDNDFDLQCIVMLYAEKA